MRPKALEPITNTKKEMVFLNFWRIGINYLNWANKGFKTITQCIARVLGGFEPVCRSKKVIANIGNVCRQQYVVLGSKLKIQSAMCLYVAIPHQT